MSEAKHTPGPWRLAKEPPNVGMTVTLYGYGPATLGVLHTGRDEFIANARLITAAPELYAAADKALHELDGILSSHEGQAEHYFLKQAYDALEAALNKADGGVKPAST